MPKTSIKVLLIEDNPADVLLLKISLGNDPLADFQVTVAEQLEQGLAELDHGSFDVLLLDLGLPDSQGMETFETAYARFPNVPVIVLSGMADELLALQAVQAGAQDYLVKGEAGWNLGSRAIRYAIERHQSQQAMRASQARFSTFFHANPMPTAITRLSDNRIADVNKAWEQAFGYSRVEAIGHTPLELNLWAYSEQRDNLVEMLRRDGSVSGLEFKARRKSGQLFDMLLSAELIELDGEPCLFLIAPDVTERKQAVDKAAQTEKHFRSLIENAPDGVVLIGLDGKYKYASPAALRIFNYQAEDVVGGDANELTHPEDLPMVLKTLQSLIANPSKVPTIQYRFKHRNGEWRWIESTFTNLLAESSVEAIAINFRDITERKLADEKLRESEESSRLAHDAADLGTWYENLTTHIFHLDERARQHYDQDETFTTLQAISARLHPEDASHLLGEIQEVINNTNNRLVTEYRVIHRDGSIHWLAIHARVHLEEHDGERLPVFVAGTSQDITARKDSEQKLIQRTQQLRLINEATRKLNSSLKAQHVHEVIHTSISQLMPCDTLLVSSFDPASKMISLASGWHDGQPMDISKYEPIPLEPQGSGTQSEVIRSKESLLVSDFQARLRKTQVVHNFDENDDPVEEASKYTDVPRSALVVPLLIEGEVFGVIQVFSYQMNAYTQDDLEILNGFGSQAAISLSNAHLYEHVQQENLERKQAEKALQESEQKYRLLFDEMLSGVAVHEIICDPQGKPIDYRFVSINAAFEKMTGLTSAEVVGKSVMEVMPATESLWVERYGQVALTRIPTQFESYAGEVGKYFEVRAFSPEKGKFATIFNDVTERKQAEVALRESEALYRKAIQVAGAVPYLQTYINNGSDIHYDFIGEGIREITGYEAGEFSSRLWDSLIEESILMGDLAGYSMAEAIRLARSGEVPLWKCETRLRARDGKIHWVIETAVELYAENGVAKGSIGIFQDITERKQAEERLRSSHGFLQSVQDALSAHIAILDHEGMIVQVNTAWRNFGAQNGLEHPNHCLGVNYLDVCDSATGMYAEESSITAKAIRDVLSGKMNEVLLEYPCHKPRGEKRWFIARITSFENGGQKWVVVSHENITARKLAEIDIKERTEDLELINTLNEAVNRGDNLNKTMELFSNGLRKISVCKDSVIYLLSPDGENLIMQHLGITPGLLKQIERLTHKSLPNITIPINKSGSFQRTLQTEQAIILTDSQTIQNRILELTEASPLPAALRATIRKFIPQIYALLDIRSTLIVPLISDKRVIGLLEVSSAEVLTGEDLSRIQKISGQLTAVIMQEQARAALLESEERYRSIFDGVQDAIFVEAKDGRILEVNNRACEMYGYTRSEFLGKTYSDIVPEGNSVFFTDASQQAISLARTERINRRASGELFPVEVSGGLQSINGEEILLVMVRDITERKQAEEALNESKLSFHLLIESLPQNIYAKDADGRFIFANQNYCNTQGRSLDEILGKTDFDFHPIELAEKYLLDDQQVIKTGKTIELEEEHQVIGGKKSFVDVIKTPFSYSKGQPVGILGIFWDITERKKIEENTRQRVKALELLYENSMAVNQSLNPNEVAQEVIELLGEKLDWHHTAIRLLNEQDNRLELAAFDLQGTVEGEEKSNQAHLRKLITRTDEGLSGWAIQQSRTLRFGDVTSDPHYLESYPGMHSGLYAPLKSGDHLLGVISIESEKPNAFSEADEQLITTLANQASVALENARLYREISLHAEELEKRVRERTAEIETTRRRLELAVKTAGIGIWELDIKQNKDYWDDRLFALYGLSPKTSLADPQTWRNAIHPDDLNEQLTIMDEALHNNRPYNTEFRVVLPNGNTRYIKSSGLVIPDAAGKAERMIGANQDITIHKQAEEALSLANAEMERGLRMKNEFLANMSHELRTPLNAILGISESLEEQISGTLNEKQMRYIRTIIESGRHLLDLINDILDLSKIEAGKLEISVQNISVEKLCTTSLRMIKELAQKKSLYVSLKIDENVKFISGDERRLKQSLVNLLGNAVKFTPQGKKIGLEVKGDTQTNEVTFTIWDEGIGIEQENIQQLFKPFVQLNAGLAREYAGTGLGLALVAQMVRLHGGRIDLTSEVNMGSRFIITLPWMPKEQEIQPTAKLQALEDDPTLKVKRTGKILIVDDTEVVAQLMSEYLRHKGYETFIAYNGREGVTLARQEHPQIILMDIMMPVMNGLEATKQIRADAALRNIPIIGLTALAMSSDREQCLAAGMNDHMSKPIEMQELIKTIERYLAQSR